MKTNIAILLIVGILTYALTLYLSRNNITADVKEVPNKETIKQDVNNGQVSPDFKFVTIKDTQHNAVDFKGKTIILNFWASWCAPCIKEFPNLLAIAEQYKEDVVLIALSSDLEEAAITKFIDKMTAQQNLNFNADNIFIALDQDQKITHGLFQTFKLPETIIIDENFTIRHKLIGADWTKDDLSIILEGL